MVRFISLAFLGLYLSNFAAASNLEAELPPRVTEVLSLLETHSIYTKNFDFNKLKDELLLKMKSLEEVSWDVELREMVTRVGGNHSFYLSKNVVQYMEDHKAETNAKTQNEIKLTILKGKWAYLSIPGFGILDNASKETLAYIKKLSDFILEASEKNIEGWIIDLRKNDGGNLYPMLAAISPLLPDGDLGYFTGADSLERHPWGHAQGSIYASDMKVIENTDYKELHTKRLPKAVLVGKDTASSGEFVLISLKSRPETKVFGQSTYGVPTGNEVFVLSDGAQLIVTSALTLDVKGRKYFGPIAPDLVVEETEDDRTLQTALQWLEGERTGQDNCYSSSF